MGWLCTGRGGYHLNENRRARSVDDNPPVLQSSVSWRGSMLSLVRSAGLAACKRPIACSLVAAPHHDVPSAAKAVIFSNLSIDSSKRQPLQHQRRNLTMRLVSPGDPSPPCPLRLPGGDGWVFRGERAVGGLGNFLAEEVKDPSVEAWWLSESLRREWIPHHRHHFRR